ncbi:MAG: serine hydrolase domain-containing protein [Rikenellaceae bacterium]
MNRKIVSIVVTLVSIIAIIISLRDQRADLNIEVVDEEEQQPISINSLLDNTMSSFEQTKTFDRDIESFMRRWGLKGASFALMRNDSLIYAKGYGFANDSMECDANNIFRVASVSKLLTAVAVMRLAEQGKISLSSKVFGAEGILCDSMFLDLRNKNLEQITVEHLMRHTAGFSSPHGDPAFSNYNVARYLDKELPLSLDDMVLYATKNRLRSRPGDRYDYSNLGYMILTKVVEKCSNIAYENYVRDSILAPIGCYDMHIGKNFSQNREDNEVSYFEVKEATPVEAFDGSGRYTMKSNGGNDVTLLSGAGGWVASPSEILRFVAAINDCDAKDNFLSQESIEAMTYDSKRYKPMGWATVRGDEWLRSGSMAGTSALIKKQKDGYTWVFVSNSSAWVGHKISSYISSHVTRSMAKVKEWPQRDLFAIENIESLRLLYGDNFSEDDWGDPFYSQTLVCSFDDYVTQFDGSSNSLDLYNEDLNNWFIQ